MEVDAAESKQVYKPAKLAPVYYGQRVYFLHSMFIKWLLLNGYY